MCLAIAYDEPGRTSLTNVVYNGELCSNNEACKDDNGREELLEYPPCWFPFSTYSYGKEG